MGQSENLSGYRVEHVGVRYVGSGLTVRTQHTGVKGKINDHMSVRRNSLYNSMPWTIWGGPIAFGGLGVGYKERYRLWGFQPNSHGYILD